MTTSHFGPGYAGFWAGERDIDGRPTLGDRYRLMSLLGQGGMSDVYRARDVASDRDVAVKVFRPGAEFIDAERRRRHEVDMLASLNHPGLVAVLDADVSSDATAVGRVPYIVLELVEGPTLGQRIRRNPLSERQVAALGTALCSTLEYIHHRGIVHRDIKPANVLLPSTPDTAYQGPKLTDFGIALIVDSTRMTTEGFTVGTANYLSPEQVTGAPVGTPSDIYSLGLVLIEAITGSVVFAGHGVEAALSRLHSQPRLPGGMNPKLATVLTAMTARDPARRVSAHDAVRLLAEIAEPSLTSDILRLGAFAAATEAIAVGAHRRRRSRRRAAFAAAGILLAAAVAGGILRSGGNDPVPTRAAPPQVAPTTSRGTSATPVGRTIPVAGRTVPTASANATGTRTASAVARVTHSARPVVRSSAAGAPAPIDRTKAKVKHGAGSPKPPKRHG